MMVDINKNCVYHVPLDFTLRGNLNPFLHGNAGMHIAFPVGANTCEPIMMPPHVPINKGGCHE